MNHRYAVIFGAVAILIVALSLWWPVPPLDSPYESQPVSDAEAAEVPPPDRVAGIVEDEWSPRELQAAVAVPPEVSEPAAVPQRPDPPRPEFVRLVGPNRFIVRVGGRERLGYLAAVLAPSECADRSRAVFDAEAHRFVRNFVEGEEMRVWFERTVEGRETYGVTRRRDRKNLNLAVLRNGYGCLDEENIPPSCPYGFEAQSRLARVNERGMWRGDTPYETGFVTEARNAIALFERRQR